MAAAYLSPVGAMILKLLLEGKHRMVETTKFMRRRAVTFAMGPYKTTQRPTVTQAAAADNLLKKLLEMLRSQQYSRKDR